VKVAYILAISTEEQVQLAFDQPTRASKMRKSPTHFLFMAPFDFPALFHVSLQIIHKVAAQIVALRSDERTPLPLI